MADPRPKLILIDGHALAYRQYFALPVDKFTTQSGEPTNATFGFARTLLDILQTNPHYLAVSFDQGLSGRDVIYPEYKGTRSKMGGDLYIQMDRIRELVQAFNIPILEMDGIEADDVIGSAARQAELLNVFVHILTGDRDLLQLVTANTEVELPGKTLGDGQVYNTERVIAEYGIRPDQIPDFKGLVGDASDNIPGVMGIGDKTASALLQQYETLHAVYEHVGEQKKGVQAKLIAGRESAFISKTLAAIKTDIPVVLDLEKCVAGDYNRDVVAELFRQLEFRKLIDRLPVVGKPASAVPTLAPPLGSDGSVSGQQMSLFEMAAPISAVPVDTPVKQIVETVVVDTPEALADLVSVLADAQSIAFDTETTAIDPIRAGLVGISLAVSDHLGYYIPVGHIAPEGPLSSASPRQLPLDQVIRALTPAMTDPAKEKWAHNATFDLIMLRRYGLDVAPITFDTMIAEWVLNPDSRNKGLKDQAWIRLNIEMTPITDLIGKGKTQITMDRVAVDRAAPYAAADAAMTYALVGRMRPELEKESLWLLFKDIEMPLVPVLATMDMNGVRLDLPYLAHLGVELDVRLDAIQRQIFVLAGREFNIGSPKQLNEILFETLALPTDGLSRSSHGYSVDADALEGLKDQHAVVASLLEWRGLEKLKNTYVDALQTLVDQNERVHTTYNQTGAVTGRLSSESPNLQNIPIRTEEGRRVRRGFIAAHGCHLLSVDYSQIELRILAHYSRDPFMLEAFAHGQDIHTATAAAVYNIPYEQVTKEQRYLAKRVNFGLMYGMGAYRLTKETGLQLSEANEFITRYFARLPGVKNYLQGSEDLAAQQGYLETLFGRRRHFPALQNTTKDRISSQARARAKREAINMPVQGTNADIIKRAMIRLPAHLQAAGYQAKLILQVHDELVLEVPDAEIAGVAALVRTVMESAATLDVPLHTEAKVGLNWSDMTLIDEVADAARVSTHQTGLSRLMKSDLII